MLHRCVTYSSKNESEIAAILGHSEKGVNVGFTSGIKEKGEPEYFLRTAMKSDDFLNPSVIKHSGFSYN